MVRPFIGCDACEKRANIEFFYPCEGFRRNPTEVADNLQAAFEYLAGCYPARRGIDYKKFFSGGDKIIAGYRRGKQHSDDGQPIDEPNAISAGYCHNDRRINIPWDLLYRQDCTHGFTVGLENQPEYCCGHELAHAFESLCLDGNQNREEWKEGLCDFTRLLLLNVWSGANDTFTRACEHYNDYISNVNPSGEDDSSPVRKYHYAARLILQWFRKNGHSLCPSHLGTLFDGNMNEILGSWRT